MAKYYAYFESSASYSLITRNQWNEIPKENIHFKLEHIPFEKLKDAKDYLLMHFNGEISDARSCIKQIRQYRAQDQK